jgi:hypothetical protein
MSLLDDLSIITTASADKAGTLYSIIPDSGLADLDITRATTATRTVTGGLVVPVAINEPQIDHADGGSCPALLLEPARTNICLQSQTIDNATWTKVTGGTGSAPVVTANNALAPDNTTTAEKVVFDLNGGTTSSDYSYLNQNYTQAATSYTISCYLKGAVGGEKVTLDFDNGITNIVTLTTSWVRYTYSKAVTNTGSKILRIATQGDIATDDNPTIYMWGCQLEAKFHTGSAASFATSYIPTTTTTVTRNKTQFSQIGLASLLNPTEGVLFLEAACFVAGNSNQHIMAMSNNNAGDHVNIGQWSGSWFASASMGGVNLIFESAIATVADTYFHKVAIKYKSAYTAVFFDGALISHTNNLGTPSGTPMFKYSDGYAGIDLWNLEGKIRSIQYYPLTLSDAQVITLTTP